jgi:hypothetical protein
MKTGEMKTVAKAVMQMLAKGAMNTITKGVMQTMKKVGKENQYREEMKMITKGK